MKRISSARAKACQIPHSVMEKVYERDQGRCIMCEQNNGQPVAHFVPRSRGGLGIEENIMTLCWECHDLFDHGARDIRELMRLKAIDYFKSIYPDWDINKLYYKNRGK